jgi:thioredoxin 1
MKPIELTDDNFQKEVLDASTPVLVDFWAVWCGPCKMIAPVVEDIAKEYTGQIKVGKLDVDANAETAMKFGIRSIPTLLVFKDGKVVEQIIGAMPKRNLLDRVLPHVGVN